MNMAKRNVWLFLKKSSWEFGHLNPKSNTGFSFLSRGTSPLVRGGKGGISWFFHQPFYNFLNDLFKHRWIGIWPQLLPGFIADLPDFFFRDFHKYYLNLLTINIIDFSTICKHNFTWETLSWTKILTPQLHFVILIGSIWTSQ